MQITLSQEQTQVLEALVKHGQYPSLEEAINTALLLLIDDITLSDDSNSPNYLAWVQETGKKINIAREQAQRGELLNADDVLAQLRDKVKKAREIRA
jgi:Arc/MetJ-type ribon-helix-helix transcriptional regulator